mmetsp:Transcript_39363/g.99764  ORF Transcript_39363/g.99764 Transcript_39363/m.99764 type:complete len:91 (-) Transcript_39363:663-935(-)
MQAQAQCQALQARVLALEAELREVRAAASSQVAEMQLRMRDELGHAQARLAALRQKQGQMAALFAEAGPPALRHPGAGPHTPGHYEYHYS